MNHPLDTVPAREPLGPSGMLLLQLQLPSYKDGQVRVPHTCQHHTWKGSTTSTAVEHAHCEKWLILDCPCPFRSLHPSLFLIHTHTDIQPTGLPPPPLAPAHLDGLECDACPAAECAGGLYHWLHTPQALTLTVAAAAWTSTCQHTALRYMYDVQQEMPAGEHCCWCCDSPTMQGITVVQMQPFQ